MNKGILCGLFVSLAVLAGCSDQEGPTTPIDRQLNTTAEPELLGSVDHASDDVTRELDGTGAQFNLVGPASLAPTVFNTDFVAAGVGAMRNQPGPHTITLTGVSGSVSQALLYWHGPTNSTNPLANANVMVNGSPVVGANIGFSDDNCWGFANSQAYVADVTAYVLGNGVYALTGFGYGAVNTNGASIVVFYNDGDGTNNRDVVLFEGNDSNINNPFDPPGWTVTLAGIMYTGGTAGMQLHIADGQNFIDDALLVNGVIKFPISNWATGFTVPGVNNGPQNDGRLWDIINVDVTGELAAAGPPPQALQLTTGVRSDCLALTAAVVDLPAGAAPGNVDIDIKPGSWPNSINTKNKGVIPVAILGSDLFDVTTVDVTTLVFGPDGATPVHDLTDPLVYADHLQDVNSDGYTDLVSHYATQDAGFVVGDTEGCIDGSTLSAAPIHGCDAVRIVK